MFDVNVAYVCNGPVYVSAGGKHVHVNISGNSGDVYALRYGGAACPADVDGSGTLDISDPVMLALGLFGGGVMPCEKSADINDSNGLDIADAILLLDYLFSDGFAPAMPFPMCGFDPTPDDLTCTSSPGC